MSLQCFPSRSVWPRLFGKERNASCEGPCEAREKKTPHAATGPAGWAGYPLGTGQFIPGWMILLRGYKSDYPSRSVVYARDHGVTLQLRPSTWSYRYHRTLNIMEACGSRPSCHELKASISVVLPSFSQLWVFTVGTPKYLAKKVKSKGLQRLRWYCQVCQKQCRDAN